MVRHMSEDTRNIIVGALALVALVALAAISFTTTTVAQRDGGYHVNAVFSRVDGLAAGDQVHMGGIRIGRVAKLGLTKNYGARVEMRIDAGVELPDDSSAAIVTDGLFGSKVIAVEPGGALENIKDGGSITVTQGSVVVQDLLDLIIGEAKSGRAEQPGNP